MSLGSNIKYYRINKGLSQSKLAHQLHVKTKEVVSWEQDRSRPDYHALRQLSRILDVNVDDLTAVEMKYESYNSVSKFGHIIRNDEEILWEGKPDASKNLTKQDIFLIPFGLFFFGFAIFWTVMASSFGGFIGVFGLPFIGVGFYMVFLRFGYVKRRKMNTYYAVTNKRVIRYIDGVKQVINEIRLNNITNLSIDINREGIGSITFNNITNNNYYHMHHRMHNRTGMNYMVNDYDMFYAFLDIPNARHVYNIINDLLEKNNQIADPSR